MMSPVEHITGVTTCSVVLHTDDHLLRNPQVQAQFQLLLLFSTTSFPHVLEALGVHGPSTEWIDTLTSSSAFIPIVKLYSGLFVHVLSGIGGAGVAE
jgi:hypothetical protein